ncbi:Dps family protein [Roseococcus sp. SDR]|uniref:Dps family protein n=1 Tax=Roseococcus sp. SDR TaxID=2835532 RepID=UPI0020BD50E1|nr:DNA starvation/stationary phase protection protein [Roseococcus sp. SDR]
MSRSTPSQPRVNAAVEICESLNGLLADTLALYLKTKNFHWHVSGPNFREYHLLLDEQATKIFAVVDDIAERVRKLGGATLRSINQAAAMTRIAPNEADDVSARDMLAELLEDNRAYAACLRTAHEICDGHGDVATASLLEVWIDDAEQRIWFLQATTRGAEAGRS